jgi:hypothetical protein
MNRDEIICQYIEKNKKILYIGTPCDDIIKKEATPSELQVLNASSFPATDETSVSKDFDYIIFTDALELVDNPKDLITALKYNSNNVIVYEFKYDYMDDIDSTWKKPWLKVGLEHILTWEFDYVQSIYLGYATLYLCNGPNSISPTTLEEMMHEG